MHQGKLTGSCLLSHFTASREVNGMLRPREPKTGREGVSTAKPPSGPALPMPPPRRPPTPSGVPAPQLSSLLAGAGPLPADLPRLPSRWCLHICSLLMPFCLLLLRDLGTPCPSLRHTRNTLSWPLLATHVSQQPTPTGCRQVQWKQSLRSQDSPRVKYFPSWWQGAGEGSMRIAVSRIGGVSSSLSWSGVRENPHS